MNWTGRWITGSAPIDDDAIVPPYIFQKRINCKKEVLKAVVYATALGAYVIRINGERISERYFTPGYTQYDKRVLYNEYDVTEHLKKNIGEVCQLRTELSGGWYAGRLGLCLKRNRFGAKRAFIMELHVTYVDGETEIIATDESWQVTTDGPRSFADFFDGEVYDARKEEIPASSWEQVTRYEGPLPERIEAEDGVPVLRHECIRPKRIWKSDDGEVLIDFGRNMAGVVQIGPFLGKAGEKIIIRHGELVQENQLYTKNLRTAKATLVYTCKDGEQTYIPEFTYMGFQYISVKGIEVAEENICAWELYSDMETIGTFECSDENLNQLQRNIMTSLKANFVDIPTDCPQRDERCGWTGDIAVFAPTAAFNMDISKFMKKWLRDLALSQQESGVVGMIVPNNGFGMHKGDGLFGVLTKMQDAVWGDASILVPWAIYQSTGDVSILESQYESMKAWIGYEERMTKKRSFGANKYIWTAGFHFGDWLAPGESMLDNMKKAKWTSTAYFANSAKILSHVAAILGHEIDSRRYQELYENIRKAFQKVLIDAGGHIKKGFQSAYVLALQFGLLTEEQERIAVADLVEDIRKKDNHLATGFVGTADLPFVLSDHGQVAVAYDLLLQDTYPSWLYPILCGATSMWERWDSLRPDGTVYVEGTGEGNMVSFNHYAYGAIGNWLYTRVGGLEMTKPGYKEFRIAPMPGGGLTFAKVSHKSPYGKIQVEWKIKEDQFILDFAVPENTKAEVILPDGNREWYASGQYQVISKYKGDWR
ncbi:MAG: family 78 glycoside hydrolase catalytic domain [Agathobacter sp.]|nr:family 78 glycoside hydrolase catalytic domain [Agathobacter sp.]